MQTAYAKNALRAVKVSTPNHFATTILTRRVLIAPKIVIGAVGRVTRAFSAAMGSVCTMACAQTPVRPEQ
jgi:hypothetical protein